MSFISDNLFGGKDARKASNATADATAAAGRLQLQSDQEARALQEKFYNQSRSDMQPVMDVGLKNLRYFDQIAGQGGPQLQGLQDYKANQFNFDPSQIANNPSYQFNLNQGLGALDRIAAKNRNLGSGNRMTAATDFAQGLASNELQNEYGRQMQTFQTNEGNRFNQINHGNQNIAARFDASTNDFNGRLSRIAGLAGMGQSGAQQQSNMTQSFGNTLSNIAMQSGANQANTLNNIGQARASGFLGQANAMNNMWNTAATAFGAYKGGKP